MPVTYQDFYLQKQEIEKHSFNPKEAYLRLIISRGYYASFCHAKELFAKNANYKVNVVEKNPDTNERYGSHEKFYESLMVDENENLNEIGRLLKKYHRLRKKSDYKLRQRIHDLDKKDAEDYLTECKQRIDFFLKNGPVRYT